jgi:hypothetical protein
MTAASNHKVFQFIFEVTLKVDSGVIVIEKLRL